MLKIWLLIITSCQIKICFILAMNNGKKNENGGKIKKAENCCP